MGTTYDQSDPTVGFLHPNSQLRHPQAQLFQDRDRLPKFNNRGEIIGINPRLYQRWMTEFPDMLEGDLVWNMVTDPTKYPAYGAKPLDSNSNIQSRAPVDLLMQGPQRVILHEVSGVFC